MKRNKLFVVMTALALSVFFLFSACGGDDSDGGGINAPSAGKLPSLPTGGGVAAVSTVAEAANFLAAIGVSGLPATISSETETVVESTPANDGYKWSVTDSAEIEGYKITSKGSVSVNDNGGSAKSDTTIVLTKNKEFGNVKFLSGSSFEEHLNGSGRVNSKGQISFNSKESYAYGVTVVIDKQTAKVTLGLTIESNGSFNFDDFLNPDKLDDIFKAPDIKGSLNVYGEDDKTPILTQDISNTDDLELVAGWLGISFGDEFDLSDLLDF